MTADFALVGWIVTLVFAAGSAVLAILLAITYEDLKDPAWKLGLTLAFYAALMAVICGSALASRSAS